MVCILISLAPNELRSWDGFEGVVLDRCHAKIEDFSLSNVHRRYSRKNTLSHSKI